MRYSYASLSRNAYNLWEIARNAGFTPRELSSSYKYSTYTIEVEQLIPNAIALCYTGKADAETIISALYQLHALGVKPTSLTSSTIFFSNIDHPLFLTTGYSKTHGEFNREEYDELISSLMSHTHIKKNIRKEEIIMCMQAASIHVAPEVLQVLEDSSLVTHRYPYSLSDAALNGVKLSLEAKISLEAKMCSLHSLGILHRDVTEENFVCNLNGTKAYIIDFGLSIRVDTVSLDTLIQYIEDFEHGEIPLGDRNELTTLAKQLELRKLSSLLKHF